jgi:ATP-dependent Lon protease
VEVAWQVEQVEQIKLETAAAVLGKRHLQLTQVKEYLQALLELQSNMVVAEMATTLVQQQQLQDLVPEVMASKR